MMKNICFPGDRIEDIFDIKGCLAGRFQKVRKYSVFSRYLPSNLGVYAYSMIKCMSVLFIVS